MIDLAKLGPSAQVQLRAQGIDVDRLMRKQSKRARYQRAPKERRTVDGKVFDSEWESEVYVWLKRLVGLDRMELQPRFELQPEVTVAGKTHARMEYVADFMIRLPDGEHVIDAKGHLTEVFRLKEKLFVARFNRPIVQLHNLGQLLDFLRRHGVQTTG